MEASSTADQRAGEQLPPVVAVTGVPAEQVEYTISRLEQPEEHDPGDMWADIVTVSVPKRSQTRTVLFAGLEKLGISPQSALQSGQRFRVLDAETAKGHGLKVKEPREPEIELA